MVCGVTQGHLKAKSIGESLELSPLAEAGNPQEKGELVS